MFHTACIYLQELDSKKWKLETLNIIQSAQLSNMVAKGITAMTTTTFKFYSGHYEENVVNLLLIALIVNFQTQFSFLCLLSVHAFISLSLCRLGDIYNLVINEIRTCTLGKVKVPMMGTRTTKWLVCCYVSPTVILPLPSLSPSLLPSQNRSHYPVSVYLNFSFFYFF